MTVYNNFFWKKAEEAGLISYNKAFEEYVGDLNLVYELYFVVAESLGHPDGNAVKYIEKHINDSVFSIFKLKFVTDETAIKVAFLLNQFGLKIGKHYGYYVVVNK